jgi:regulator of sigma E protease
MMVMTNILWSALFFIVAIGPLVFVHEMGHYLVGRWCGVKADVFSIGFGREIAGWTDKRGTRWKLGWLPMGGYVRFAGDMSPVSEPNAEWLSLPIEERNKTFQSKAVWQRALIVLAGPMTNFLAAVLILGGFAAVYGEWRTPAIAARVVEGTPADRAGIRQGDLIVRIADTKVTRFEDIMEVVEDNPGVTMPVDVMRGGQLVRMRVTPALTQEIDRFGNKYSVGRIGIGQTERVAVPVPLAQVPGVAVSQTYGLLTRMANGVLQIVTGRRPIDQLGGPLKMAQMTGQVATLGWQPFVELIAMISINLGFINLLPIPMLDGGHLAFYAAEALRRKGVSPQVQEWAFRSGLLVLLTFMLFVTFHNDFKSLGIWDRLAGLIG